VQKVQATRTSLWTTDGSDEGRDTCGVRGR